MSGFEIFLCVLAGIILLIVIILSIPVHVSFRYTDDKIYLAVRYTFIKLNILPLGDKKEKKEKEKKEKKEKSKKKKDEEEKKEEEPKEKKPNSILQMIKSNGFDGMVDIIVNLGSVIAKFGGKLFKSVRFNDIRVYSLVGTGDAASTAIKYGETCQKVYPVVGFICSNNFVKRYDIDIKPDFLANTSENEMYLDLSIVVRKILNAAIGLVFRLLFKVVIKFLKNGRNKEDKNVSAEKKTA